MFNEANIIQIVIADYKLRKMCWFHHCLCIHGAPQYEDIYLKQILQIILASHDIEIKNDENLQTHMNFMS